MNFIPKFEEENNDTLLLDHSFYKSCLEYAVNHSLNVLYTETSSTGAVSIIYEFMKHGYAHKLYEVPQYAPDGLRLENKIYCRFTRKNDY